MPLYNHNLSLFGEGVKLNFSTSTSDIDPGTGIFCFNNSTQNLATLIYINLLDSSGIDITNYLDSLDNSNNPSIKGTIRLTSYNSPNKWLEVFLTEVIVATGYRKLAISNISYSTANPFSNGEAVVLSFSRAGDVIGSGADVYVPVHDERLYHEQQLTNNKLDQIIQFLLDNQ